MKRAGLALVIAALTASVASAQPMAMDPRQVSGQPRAEPNDPPGKLTVRVIQGRIEVDAFGNPQSKFPPGQVVHLVAVHADGSATVESKPVDGGGRAIFDGLVTNGSSAYYAVTAMPRGDVVDRLRTELINMPPKVGMRVMLAGEDPASGKPVVDDWADPRIPPIEAGQIIVEVRGSPELWKGAKEVVLTELTTGQKITVAPQILQDAAAALFENLPIDGKVYIGSVVVAGRVYRTEPIVLTPAAGAFGSIFAYPSLLMQFHAGAEVTDSGLEVDIQFALANGTGSPLDPGPDGVVIPLPDGFEKASVLEGKEHVGVGGDGFVWRGVFPPGQKTFVGRFRIPVDGDGKARLAMPMPYGALQSQISMRSPDGEVRRLIDECVHDAGGGSGAASQRVERLCMHNIASQYVRTGNTQDKLRFTFMDSAAFLVVPNITVGAGQTLTVYFEGLPTPPGWWGPAKTIAGVLVICALLIASAGLYLSRDRAGVGEDDGGAALVIERDKLYERLVRLERSHEAGRMPEGRYKKQRKELKSKLVDVYEQLRQRTEA